MKKSLVAAMALVAAAGAAHAQTVEFRVIERQGQMSWNPSTAQTATNDNVFNFAVQARVVGGAANTALGNHTFNVVMPGEAETAGDLTTAAISASNGQYTPTNYADDFTVGTGGVAHVYSYLAGINPSFIGIVNASDGAWTQTSSQDIGLITGAPIGSNMLHIFGGTGSGATRPATVQGDAAATVAPLDAALANQYLGANGNFIDVYHFNYTVSNTAARAITVNLTGASAQVFTAWAKANGLWGPGTSPNVAATTAGLTVQIVPAPGAAALLGLGGLVATRRRRTA